MKFKMAVFVVAIAVTASGAPKKEKLSTEDKRIVREGRKAAAAAKNTVKREFVCGKCKGAGRIAKSVRFGDRGEFKKESIIDCSKCGGLGLCASAVTHNAMAEYYRVIAGCEDRLRYRLEDVPSLARWMLNKIRTPAQAMEFSSVWRQRRGSSKQGDAYLLAVECVGAWKNVDPPWVLFLATPLGSRSEDCLIILFHEAPPRDLARAAEWGTQERFLVVAYSEGTENYKAWLKRWENVLRDPKSRSRGTQFEVENKESLAILKKVIARFGKTGYVLTGADAVAPRDYMLAPR